MSNIYDIKFFNSQSTGSMNSAEVVLPIALNILPPVKSAVDFGCGVGGWLAVLKKHGVSEIQGIDGDWVHPDLLKIPADNFRKADLDSPITLDKKYDLAMSLEVAEHLDKNSAISFVQSLCNASDFILFSAAIPFQGGKGHINEQWQDYWAELFAARGYQVLDIIRSQIWNNNLVEVWYRQNTLLFIKEERILDLASSYTNENLHLGCLSTVHPLTHLSYSKKLNHAKTVKGAFRLLRKAVKKSIKESCKLFG